MKKWEKQNLRKKKKRAERVKRFREEVIPILESQGITIKEFCTNSFNITDHIKTIDFYPSSSKVNIRSKEKTWFIIDPNLDYKDIAYKLMNYLL